MTNSIQRWGTYTAEVAEAEKSRVDALANSTWMSLAEGDNVVRILPPPVGKNSPFRVTAMHYVDAIPGADKLFVFACPRVELKKPCPVCAESERLLRSGNPLDRERSYGIAAGLRILVNVIDRANPDRGPVVLSLGKTLHQQLTAIRKSQRGGGDFTDPTGAGFDIVINRQGTGKLSKYTLTAERINSPLAATEEEIIAILEQQHDLDALVDPTVPEPIARIWSTSNMTAPLKVPVKASALPAGAPTSAPVGSSLMSRGAVKTPVASTAVADGAGNDPFADG